MVTKDNFVHYLTQIDSIDDKHWELLDSMNTMVSMIRDEKYTEVRELGVMVKQMLIDHQMKEEAMMEAIQYPYIEYHRKAHKEQLKTYDKLLNDLLTESPYNRSVHEFELQFINHIDHIDMVYVNWIKDNNIEVPDHK